MLNPSTADEAVLDPTVRRCEDFSRAWGYRRLVVCNLFALRSTDPKALKRWVLQGLDPIGPDNDRVLEAEAKAADLVVTAWGRHGRLLGRGLSVLARLGAVRALSHLGLNQDGTPQHPLYLNAALMPQRWSN